MRILLVKTSSLGDVIHNLPVVSDILQHFPNATVDWCVEENFAAIPRLHPGVTEVIPVAIRRWRKRLFQVNTWQEINTFGRRLKAHRYDAVIDTQGLLKSAMITRQANGAHLGYDSFSARESIAARFYDRTFSVSTDAHAVIRNRQLVAAALGYALPETLDYGVSGAGNDAMSGVDWLPTTPYVTLLTATSRDDKLWLEASWVDLGNALRALGYTTVLPGGSPIERERAARLASQIPDAIAAPALGIDQLATVLAESRAAVGVDTGLTHLSVALNTPTVAIYTATDPGLTGVLGPGFHKNLGGKQQMPTPEAVLEALRPVLN